MQLYDRSGRIQFAGEEFHYSWWVPGRPVLKCTESLCAIDCETELIQNRFTAPPVVVMGVASGNQVQLVYFPHIKQYLPLLFAENPDVKFVFFNGPFDMWVTDEDLWMPELNKDGRVLELQPAYTTYRMSTKGWFSPGFNLAYITRELLGTILDKDETIRLTYNRTDDLSDDHIKYIAKDPIATLLCGRLLNNQPCESVQARACYVLAHMSRNGMLVDQAYLQRKMAVLQTEVADLAYNLRDFGYNVKDAYADMSNRDAFIQIATHLRLDGTPEDWVGDDKVISTWFWKALALSLYVNMANRNLPSAFHHDVRELLVLLRNSRDDAAFKKWKKEIDDTLLQILTHYECTECLVGFGGQKPDGRVPWKLLSIWIAEAFNQGTPQSNYMKDPIFLQRAMKLFQEEHEYNRGWLASGKKLSPTAFLQQHVKNLMSQYPTLELPLTDGAKKAINLRKLEEAKAAKKEKRKQIRVETADLVKYKITGKEKWRFTDVGINDPFLEVYFKFKHAEKLLSTYITPKYIEADGRVHTRFTVSLVTGRTGLLPLAG